jgi:predicted CXXCH cytochrome family protein
MKRTIHIAVLVFALLLAMVGTASANGGPHGGYTATTDSCAGCHRAHTATGPNLLMHDSSYALCMTCHGSTGTGANTNVDDGYYLSTRDDAAGDGDHGAANTPDNASLLGGGFVNYGGVPVTSIHMPDGTEDQAWGNGVARGVTSALTEGGLSCASCHDPHGSPNYRIINETVNGVAVAVAQVDEGAKDYDTEHWGSGTSSLCAACHGAYHVTRPGSGSDNQDDGSDDYGGDHSTFAHRVDMPYSYGANANPETVGFDGYFLPLAEIDTVVCMTCHLPHGTSAQMTGITNAGGLPGETSADDSALLRLDNRGVCEVCHQK